MCIAFLLFGKMKFILMINFKSVSCYCLINSEFTPKPSSLSFHHGVQGNYDVS